MTWIGTRRARRVQPAARAETGWTSLVDAVEEELVDVGPTAKNFLEGLQNPLV